MNTKWRITDYYGVWYVELAESYELLHSRVPETGKLVTRVQHVGLKQLNR
jgi:hypothetical protein